MSDTGSTNHIQPVLHHRLRDPVDIQFRGLHANRLQPQRIDRLKRCELKLLRPQREEQLKLRVGDQSCIQQLSIRHTELRQHFLIRRVIPQRDGDGFVFGNAIIGRDAGRKLRLPRTHLCTETGTETVGDFTGNCTPPLLQFTRVATREQQHCHRGNNCMPADF